MNIATTLLAAVLLIGGCTARRTMLVADDNRVEEGELALWSDWFVDRGEKFDVHLSLKNRSKKPILVFSRDLSGGRGEAGSRARFPAFGIGERTIDLQPGEEKSVIVGFRSGSGTGDFTVTVTKVFANPSGDGKTPGDVIEEDVEWTLPEPAAR
jgi:hypothetical protein